MGRKIPGRKHRGVRDPEKQREQRLLKLKDKINAPPSDPDEQAIPKSLQEIINLKEKAKNFSRRKQTKDAKARMFKPITKLPDATVYNFNSPKVFNDPKEKPAPVFVQQKGEPDEHFLYRMSRVCKDVIKEAEFEKKYNVDIQKNPETGEVIKVSKKPKDELLEHWKRVRKEKKKGKKRKATDLNTSDEPKLTKSQKRRKKLLEKKQKKQQLHDDPDKFLAKDNVKFGEVVHEPPSLTVPKNVKNGDGAPRPGRKDLLLKSLLNHTKKEGTSEQYKKKQNLNKVNKKVIDKKGKRKDLPVALRRQLDKQQKEIIDAYRQLKKQRLKT